ncbi:PREDICTED: putative WEB family protein At1g65010, chloroplastic [Tarenaya hassleriana]|uniref:putative WEB family protein At1g65010, chloroplastic n=1 Tax=Tarenaya hassleriana TaxID=28532 RepID=UPI0008FD1202|nr:PREDICTED: putative WEB family protein At1g65010, chloroplastic [Tarenaya hassleriana]
MKMLLLLGLVLSSVYSCSNAQPQDPAACWKSIKTVEGCFESIISIFRGHFGNVKKECCETVNGFADNCWPIIFPSMPYIRFFIKGLCLLKYPQLESPRVIKLQAKETGKNPNFLLRIDPDGAETTDMLLESGQDRLMDASAPSLAYSSATSKAQSCLGLAKSCLGLAKLSGLQAQLNQVQEDLKKANEQIEFLKKEKAQTLDGLKQSEKLAEEANEKLKRHWQLRNELRRIPRLRNSELLNWNRPESRLFRKKEEAWLKEPVKGAAWFKGRKVAIEGNEVVSKLKSEIEMLRGELEKVGILEKTLKEQEGASEQIHVDLEAAKMAESCANNLAAEWKNKADELKKQVEELNKLNRSTSESMESIMKQLEETSQVLHKENSENDMLKDKVELLEMTIGQQKRDLEESGRQVSITKEESSKLEKLVESMKSNLEIAEEEKARAVDNEKVAAADIQKLLKEKREVESELESFKKEEEESKKAIESLKVDLQEVSTEAKEAKEKLLTSEVENESHVAEIESLKFAAKETNEKYEKMLEDARYEISNLTIALENAKNEFQNSKTGWE